MAETYTERKLASEARCGMPSQDDSILWRTLDRVLMLWPPRIGFIPKGRGGEARSDSGRRYADYFWLEISLGHVHWNVFPAHIRGIVVSSNWRNGERPSRYAKRFARSQIAQAVVSLAIRADCKALLNEPHNRGKGFIVTRDQVETLFGDHYQTPPSIVIPKLEKLIADPRVCVKPDATGYYFIKAVADG